MYFINIHSCEKMLKVTWVAAVEIMELGPCFEAIF